MSSGTITGMDNATTTQAISWLGRRHQLKTTIGAVTSIAGHRAGWG